MFGIGEYVVCGSKGVCVVENITKLNISGADKERDYYILKPKYVSGSTVYVPVDSTRESMRPVMKREEAEMLLRMLPEIPLLVIGNEKFVEQIYRECLKTGKSEEMVKLLKTIWLRKENRLQAGRKVTAVDEKYFHIAEDGLYGELAVALGISRDAVGEYIEREINAKV